MNKGQVDYNKLLHVGRDLLVAIGEDLERPGLVGTPERFAKWWAEFIEYDPGKTETCFVSKQVDQMVVVSGMRVFSLCEHHLLPFWCDIAIGYITRDRVLGLSKFARIAHQFAHRLQIQEQLCQQIAQEVQRLAATEDVAVIASGEHLCMSMRGIKTTGKMTTSVMGGIFRERNDARIELLQFVANL